MKPPAPDVARWLEELGLARYVGAFEQNEIDFDTLPHLTEPMLEKIGIPLGPRARLLAAISQLAPASVPDPRGSQDSAKAGQQVAERRQITVMFCDLVDSTRLVSLIDPEEFGSVMRDFQRSCESVIQRHGGHISQYRGDAVEVYFGWPVGQEDAAERGVRAALEVVEAVKAIPAPVRLSTRVGICTGVVVVSEKGAQGDPSLPSGAVGETLHVAARLQSLAAPDAVVIAESTSRLISARFEREDLGAQQLKGVAQPVQAYRVHGVREDTSRFEAARARALTPLVGRQAELAFLQQRWREAKRGEGQAVFVCGVAGIGKSRIVHELEEWIGHAGRRTLRFQCLPHCVQSTLFPIIQRLQRLAEITKQDSESVKLKRLEKFLGRATDRPERELPFIAEMMSIPARFPDPSLPLTPQQIKAQTLRFLVDLVIGAARKAPLLCVLEDAHWSDPSTEELLELLIGRIEASRILLIVTHRPEYRLRSAIHGHVSSLSITRLGRRDLAEMAKLALRDRTVSTAVIERIISESDSIPLFVEELARGAVESASAERRNLPPADLAAAWSVPESLRDSLVARLDRAPDARKVAQLAAVIGREFSYEMLRRVSPPLNDDQLYRILNHLKESEVIEEVDVSSDSRFAFKHALLRDAAYKSLLKSTRREIHAKVAKVIEEESPDVVNSQPELLAYHYNLADNAELAIRYWILGGRRAQGRSANLEASMLFEKALQLLDALPPTPEAITTKLDTHLRLGSCYIALKGYSSDATRKAFESAHELTKQVGDQRKEIQTLFGQWGHFWMRAQHDRAIELSRALLNKAELLRDPTSVLVGHRCLGSTLFTLGEFVPARAHLDCALALSKELTAESSLSLTYAVDPTIAARLMLAWDLWMLGYPDLARDNTRQALDQAIEKAHPYTLAFAHYVTSAVHLLRGEFAPSLDHATRSLAISTEHQINLYAVYARFGRGCALSKLAQNDNAIVEIREAIEEANQSNLGYMRGFMLGGLAGVQCEAGDSESALSTLDEALRQVNDVSGRAWEAELRRLYGDALIVGGCGAQEAEVYYNDAIALARKQQARSLELRATSSLARLLQSQERNHEATERLASIIAWFSEGQDTADLVQAKRLLETAGSKTRLA